jgi:hypothetical protein
VYVEPDRRLWPATGIASPRELLGRRLEAASGDGSEPVAGPSEVGEATLERRADPERGQRAAKLVERDRRRETVPATVDGLARRTLLLAVALTAIQNAIANFKRHR